MDTTTKLRRIIEDTLDFLPEKDKKETIKKTCQRTFQALRIDVNREFEVLYEFMEKLPGALFGVCKGCGASVRAGVCAERTGTIHEDALGGTQPVILIHNHNCHYLSL